MTCFGKRSGILKRALFFLFFYLIWSIPAFSTEIDGWKMNVSSKKEQEKILFDDYVEMYTGEIERQIMEKTPEDGHVYVLYEMSVSKKDGNEVLEPSDFTLSVNGKNYERIMDDYFLLDFRLRPLTHLNVKLGTHVGYILFEIPESERQYPKALLYKNTLIEKE